MEHLNVAGCADSPSDFFVRGDAGGSQGGAPINPGPVYANGLQSDLLSDEVQRKMHCWCSFKNMEL